MQRCRTCGQVVRIDYVRLAEVYRAAVVAGRPLIRTVAAEFGLTEQAANQAIYRARHKYGLLPGRGRSREVA